MTNQEAIKFLKNMIDREAIGFVCPEREGDVAIWQYHVEALQMAISALQAQDVPDTNVGDMISRQAAIVAIRKWKRYETTEGLVDRINKLSSAQTKPLLDEIVDEIRKTIAETESNGKYHADPVRHNGEMICHGLQIALNIIEEKRNERSD